MKGASAAQGGSTCEPQRAKKEKSGALVDVTHEHREPQALAGGLTRQERAPAIRQMPTRTVMLRALMHEEARPQKHGVLAVLLAQRIDTLIKI